MRILPCFVSLCLCLSTASAQTLSEKQQREVLVRSAQLMEQHYVYPDKGKLLSAALLKAGKDRAYAAIDSVKSFSNGVTALLQQTVKDGHIYLRYDPAVVKDLQAPKGNTDSLPDPFYYGERAEKNNYGFQEIKILPGGVGYLRLSEINLSPKSIVLLKAAMELLRHTQALVLDLRDNGGGGSDMGLVLEGCFVPEGTPLLEVKKREGAVTQEKAVTAGPEYKYEQPLYVLVNGRTASAAEAFPFTMQRLKRAVVVGQRTAGAAHMNEWYPAGNDFFLSVAVAAPVFPGTDISWERTGVQPDFVTADREEDLPLVLRLIAERHDAARK
ncbi:S41 family peptidase [Chitinophaga sp. HK235]|uniref:S41 family peptidase n=1 Tax=Chitinophaga sp. HK235 TaxID=2952571 RepID=UPI001BACD81E|nr:S41 family peptidase [Chitinophaga sp. HK235]